MKTSNYKGVSYHGAQGKKNWVMSITINGENYSRLFKHEREAAKAYDIERIKAGLEPVNVLKPVEK